MNTLSRRTPLFLVPLAWSACLHPAPPPATQEGSASDQAPPSGHSPQALGASAPVAHAFQPSLHSLPHPPGDAIERPAAAVSAPHLRVLPWAGFSSAISYTFDDTQPSQVEHWPQLKATGIPMTFFANPSGNWQKDFDATWSAVAAAGCEIGNHTWSHCRADLSECKQAIGTPEEEIERTTEYITTHLGVPAVTSFAAPYGDSNWNRFAAPRFLVGRGVMSGLVAPQGVSDWYDLPAIPVVAGQTATDFNRAIDRANAEGKWGIFLFHSILPTENDWYAGVEVDAILASVTHAAASGEIWLDTMGKVGAYARAQQMFEALSPSNTTWTWRLPEHFPPHQVLRVRVDGGTLSQKGHELAWDEHGYYEVALDAGQLSWSP